MLRISLGCGCVAGRFGGGVAADGADGLRSHGTAATDFIQAAPILHSLPGSNRIGANRTCAPWKFFCNIGVVLLGSFVVTALVRHWRQPVHATVVETAHCRVFEVEAAVLDRLVLPDTRQRGDKEDTSENLIRNGAPPNAVSQTAELPGETLDALLGSRTSPAGLLIDAHLSAPLWPRTASGQSYASGSRVGGIGGFLGVRRISGTMQLRVQYEVTHIISGGATTRAEIFHDGKAPSPGSARAFFIPFADKEGAARYLVVAFEADASKMSAHSYSAHISGGGSVELLGIASHSPDAPQIWDPNRRWWSPDGGVPRRSIRFFTRGARSHPSKDQQAREFVLRVNGLPPGADPWPQWKFEPSAGLAGGEAVNADTGETMQDLRAVVVTLPASAHTVNMRVGFGLQAWETVASHAGSGGSETTTFDHQGQPWSVSFLKAEEIGGAAHVTVVHTIKEEEVRVVAVDADGAEHPGGRTESAGNGDFSHVTAVFDGLPPAQIKEFRFQVRPYTWVDFRDVSLNPD